MELIAERLEEVAYHAAAAGLNENFCRHSGDKMPFAEAGEFDARQTDPHGVITGPGLLVAGYVGRDTGNNAGKLRGGSLIKGGKANHRILTCMHLIDFGWREPRIDLQLVRFRNDDHHDLCRRNDTSDGVNRQFVNNSVYRSAKFDMGHLVFCGNCAFGQLSLFVLGLSQVLHDVGPEILIQLDQLQLGFVDFAAGFGDAGNQLPTFAVEPCRLALQRCEARLSCRSASRTFWNRTADRDRFRKPPMD